MDDPSQLIMVGGHDQRCPFGGSVKKVSITDFYSSAAAPEPSPARGCSAGPNTGADSGPGPDSTFDDTGPDVRLMARVNNEDPDGLDDWEEIIAEYIRIKMGSVPIVVAGYDSDSDADALGADALGADALGADALGGKIFKNSRGAVHKWTGPESTTDAGALRALNDFDDQYYGSAADDKPTGPADDKPTGPAKNILDYEVSRCGCGGLDNFIVST